MTNYQSSNLSNKSICAVTRGLALLHVQIKLKAATYCLAIRWYGYRHLVDDRFLSREFEITFV